MRGKINYLYHMTADLSIARYQNQFKKLLRDKGISVKKLRMIRDESSPSLRLADSCAGLIRSYTDNPSALKEKLYKQLSKKITLRLEGQFTS